jgi:hypothetical protein
VVNLTAARPFDRQTCTALPPNIAVFRIWTRAPSLGGLAEQEIKQFHT